MCPVVLHFTNLEQMAPTDTPKAVVGPASFASIAVLTEIVVILTIAVTAGAAYNPVVSCGSGSVRNYFAFGSISASAYVLPLPFRNKYAVEAYLRGHRNFSRTFIS
jgi:hypothetical protein